MPDHPGLSYFAAWTAKDDVDAADNNCAAEGLDIEVEGNEKRLELANNGKGFCLRAKDVLGNQSAWAWGLPDFKTVATLSYGFGGVNVVERVGEVASDNETVYVLGNNVGSASMTLKPDGSVVANARYLPFGEERWNEVDMPNDRGYTGQRNEKGFGLMDYNARYYSTLLGRFISADTIVPNPASAESFDRYAYVSNNPIMRNDPSGHAASEGNYGGSCEGGYEIQIPGKNGETVTLPNLCRESAQDTAYQYFYVDRLLRKYPDTPKNVLVPPKNVLVPQDIRNGILPFIFDSFMYGTVGSAFRLGDFLNNLINGDFSHFSQDWNHNGTDYAMAFMGGSYDDFLQPSKLELQFTASNQLRRNIDFKLGRKNVPLAYGISNGGNLRKFADENGYALLNDIDPYDFNLTGKDRWEVISKTVLDVAAAENRPVIFNLDGMQDMGNILANVGEYANKITSVELRYVRENWNKMKNNVTFVMDGQTVSPPW